MFNSKRFDDLKMIDVLVTNKCNKRCDYCYEQHDKDYENFTVDTLKQTYDFLVEANDIDEKYMQFFGGEPLLNKELILNFLKKYARDMESTPNVKVSAITNGSLLTKEFIDEYFSYPNTQLMISLDSHKADVEHRHSSEETINQILEYCKYIREEHDGDLTIRCTLSLETLPYLEDFIKILKSYKIYGMVIHPLTLSASQGFIEWPEKDWNEMTRIIKEALIQDDFIIHFSEGTDKKGCGNNCMVGSGMIAMDGSGEYTGCYFFTNQKEALPDTVLGNILKKETNEDRYRTFEEKYAEHHKTDEKCNTCDLQGYCYQCPAGNMSTGTKSMYRSDAMCQRIVKLFLDLRRDENAKKLKKKIKVITDSHEEEGDIIFSRILYQLTYRLKSGKYIPLESLKRMKLPYYKKMMAFISIHPEYDWLQDISIIKKDIEAIGGEIESRHFINMMGKDSGTDNDHVNMALLHYVMSPKKE